MNNADNFKPDIKIYKLTESRVQQIMQYVVYCYLQLLADKKTYHYAEKGKIPKEEYLRNGIVNDYLKKTYNKEYFKQHISDNPAVEISFHPEETMTYIDSETSYQLSIDKIDIAVTENTLQSIWSEKTDNEIRFAIECKRIVNLSDTSNYVSDIIKFCSRAFTHTRLPFEGQIAFIENSRITHTILHDKINKVLEKRHSIITDSLLAQIVLDAKFSGSYLSKHIRNTNMQKFSIYHLLFDFSNIVVE